MGSPKLLKKTKSETGIKNMNYGWTNIKEAFPEDGEYLIVYKGIIITAELLHGLWYATPDGNLIPGATHWMPLPELPKE